MAKLITKNVIHKVEKYACEIVGCETEISPTKTYCKQHCIHQKIVLSPQCDLVLCQMCNEKWVRQC